MENVSRRFALDGLANIRDLGGHPVQRGGITRYGVFIRSELPRVLSGSDIKFLSDYGVRSSLDFRGDHELEKRHSLMSQFDWIDYRQHAIYTTNPLERLKDNNEVFWPTDTADWGDAYIDMAELHKDWVAEGLEYAAFCSGCLHFNCATGKDRTGVFSALLFGLAGVSDMDITADYCVSQCYLKQMYESMRYIPPYGGEPQSDAHPYFLTEPRNMEKFLRHINDKYDGIPEYVAEIGVSNSAIKAILKKFVSL